VRGSARDILSFCKSN